MILEPVFEPRFSPRSHGFRPGRNPHTAIRTVRSGFAGYLWFLKGDVTGMFEHVDVNVVMGCVGKAVKDKKVLGLIKGAFRAPVNNNGGARCSSGGKEEVFLFFILLKLSLLMV